MKILNHESGLKGICGDNDARNIEARKEKAINRPSSLLKCALIALKSILGLTWWL